MIYNATHRQSAYDSVINIVNPAIPVAQLWDFPGKLDIAHLRDKDDSVAIEKIFVDARVLIFVLDPMEDRLGHAIDRLNVTIQEAFKVSVLKYLTEPLICAGFLFQFIIPAIF